MSFDNILLSKKGKIIHQIWFGTIPNKKEAKEAYKKLNFYRTSIKTKNPKWFIFEWNLDRCICLIKTFYPEYLKLFNNYTYDIQRCDMIRYLILHRYGGWYMDMDYYCNRPLDEAMETFKDNDIALVQTPNTVIGQDIDHISNSLMWSKPNNQFWLQLMRELETNSKFQGYFPKYIEVMFTTGPIILNRSYQQFKKIYNIKGLPWEQFHPYGVKSEVKLLKLPKEVYTAHIGKSSWYEKDTNFIVFFFKEWPLLVFISLILLLPFSV
jgi:mannosyltransferase OCH1-like enzyme